MSDSKERERFLKKRTEGIGGSDVAGIIGISPFKSAFEIWHEKVYGIFTPEEDNVITKLGRYLEPFIASEYMKMTNRLVSPKREQIVHPEYKFMIANIDRMIYDRIDKDKGYGILEIKTKGAYVNWEDDDIPIYYMVQLQHYLEVTGLTWGSFAILDLGKRKIEWFDVERDDKLIFEIIEEEKKFWELVKNKTPPNIDGSKTCNEFFRKLYPESIPGKVIDLTNNEKVDKLINTISSVRVERKELDDLETEVKSKLMSIMEDAEKAVGDGFSIIWKSPKNKEVFDHKKFKAEHSDIYDKYVIIEPQTRRFTVRISRK